MRLYDKYCREMEANKAWIAPIYAYKDIEENEKAGKISSLLTLEDGSVVFNDLAMLRNYYRMGGSNDCPDLELSQWHWLSKLVYG